MNNDNVALPPQVHSGPLGGVFDDTTSSYKLFWFRALLAFIALPQSSNSIPLPDLFREMVIAAWPPVILFHLKLGIQDRLQNVVQQLARSSNLSPFCSPAEVRRALSGWQDAATYLERFVRYVPTRFITPWFERDLRGISDETNITRQITDLARARVGRGRSAPYFIIDSALQFDPVWRDWFVSNNVLVSSFVDQGLSNYLQARNPSVPGIVRKLRAPIQRDLRRARSFWEVVQRVSLAQRQELHDIFTGGKLEGRFSIDHFLPWTFVAHDELWNLAPVRPEINSLKGDRLPDLDQYLPRLSHLHHTAVAMMAKHPRLLDDHLSFFGCDLTTLKKLDVQHFERRYDEILRPQAQIAVQQGYLDGWLCSDATAAG
jgi:hypothetical protein